MSPFIYIYELVDATTEESYYPLGLFDSLERAMACAEEHFPQRWDVQNEGTAVSEVRARKMGLSGGDYAVLWRRLWIYDYDAGSWACLPEDTLTGTLEKPLPMIRP